MQISFVKVRLLHSATTNAVHKVPVVLFNSTNEICAQLYWASKQTITRIIHYVLNILLMDI